MRGEMKELQPLIIKSKKMYRDALDEGSKGDEDGLDKVCEDIDEIKPERVVQDENNFAVLFKDANEAQDVLCDKIAAAWVQREGEKAFLKVGFCSGAGQGKGGCVAAMGVSGMCASALLSFDLLCSPLICSALLCSPEGFGERVRRDRLETRAPISKDLSSNFLPLFPHLNPNSSPKQEPHNHGSTKRSAQVSKERKGPRRR